MRNQLSFSTFDPLFSDAPCLCDLCQTKPSVFQFEGGNPENNTAIHPANGFCCSSCATQLLDQLQQAESLAWAEEEASVGKEGGDVTEFHTRRLATFGRCSRG
jgi:hypothetical protein